MNNLKLSANLSTRLFLALGVLALVLAGCQGTDTTSTRHMGDDDASVGAPDDDNGGDDAGDDDGGHWDDDVADDAGDDDAGDDDDSGCGC